MAFGGPGNRRPGQGKAKKIAGTVSFLKSVGGAVGRRGKKSETVEMLNTNASQVQKYRHVPKLVRVLFVVALNSKVNSRIGLLDISKRVATPVSSRREITVSNPILT